MYWNACPQAILSVHPLLSDTSYPEMGQRNQCEFVARPWVEWSNSGGVTDTETRLATSDHLVNVLVDFWPPGKTSCRGTSFWTCQGVLCEVLEELSVEIWLGQSREFQSPSMVSSLLLLVTGSESSCATLTAQVSWGVRSLGVCQVRVYSLESPPAFPSAAVSLN